MRLLRVSFSIRGSGLSLSFALIAAGAVGIVLAQSNPAASARPASSAPSSSGGHGLDPADMNLSAKACQDYYQFGNGGWLKKNPIPPEYPSWGTFSELAERNREAMHRILEKLAKEKSAAGSDEQKLGDFYAACTDEAAVEAQGSKPL